MAGLSSGKTGRCQSFCPAILNPLNDNTVLIYSHRIAASNNSRRISLLIQGRPIGTVITNQPQISRVEVNHICKRTFEVILVEHANTNPAAISSAVNAILLDDSVVPETT
jgi:hypothetical protein